MAKPRVMTPDEDCFDGVPTGRVHRCTACGKEEPWGPGWAWYGSYKMIDDGVPIYKACSNDCMDRRADVLAAQATELQLQEAERLLTDATQRADSLRKRVETLRAARAQNPKPGGE